MSVGAHSLSTAISRIASGSRPTFVTNTTIVVAASANEKAPNSPAPSNRAATTSRRSKNTSAIDVNPAKIVFLTNCREISPSPVSFSRFFNMLSRITSISRFTMRENSKYTYYCFQAVGRSTKKLFFHHTVIRNYALVDSIVCCWHRKSIGSIGTNGSW